MNGNSNSELFYGMDHFTAVTASGQPELDQDDEELADSFANVALAVGEDSRDQGAGTLHITTRQADGQLSHTHCQPTIQTVILRAVLQKNHLVQRRSGRLLRSLQQNQHACGITRRGACKGPMHICTA